MKMSWFPQKTYSQSVLKGRRGVDAATLRNRLIKIIEFFRSDSPHTNLYCLETLLAHLNNADNTNNNNNKTTIPLPIGNIPIDSFLSPLEDLIEKTTCQAETIKKMEEELDNVKEKLYRIEVHNRYYDLVLSQLLIVYDKFDSNAETEGDLWFNFSSRLRLEFMKVRKTQIPANLNAVEARVIENSDGFIDQLFVEKCVAHRQLLLVLEGLGCTKCEFYRMYNFAKGRNESTHSNFKYLSPTDKIKFLADCTEELVQAASIFPPDLQIFVPVLKAVVNKLIA